MSEDQRPGRVRLFSSAQPQDDALRRRGDWPEGGSQDSAAHLARVAASSMAAKRKTRSSMLPMLLLFILGSTLGGMFVAALGLFKVPGL